MYTEISQKTGLIQEEVLQETFKQWKYSYLTHFVRLTFLKKYHVSQKSRSIYIDQGHTREHSSKRPALKTDCANLSCISGQLLTLQEILKISNKYFWFFKSFFFACGGPYQSENIPYFENKALLSTPEVGLLSKDHSWLQFPVFSTERIPKFYSMWISATNSPDGCVYVWEKLFTVNRNLLHTKYGVEEKTKVTPVSSPVRSCPRCCDACILPCAEQTTSRPLNRKPALRCRLLTHSDTLIKRTQILLLFNTEVSQRSPERIHP